MTQSLQFAQVIGAGLTALASTFLSRDSQGIALGRYLLAQGKSQNVNSPINLSLFYPREKVEEVAKNPARAYLNGHLWDLAHKVLAATAFYLTFRYSLIPESLKTAAWARVFFSLAPVMLKLAHCGLDIKSIKERGQNRIIESCRDTVYKLGKCVEVFYWGRLIVVPLVAAHQFDGLAAFGSLVLSPLGMFAVGESFWSSPPSHLNGLESSSKAIEKGEWNPDTLKAVAKDLAAKLGQKEQAHVHGGILDQLEKKLETEIYPEWAKDVPVLAAQQESEVRKIQGREGVYEEIGVSLKGGLPLEYFQYEMRQIRLAMMLLCLNLRRLDQGSHDGTLTQKIQNFLYLQALYYPIQTITDHENGVERRILQCYRHWKSETSNALVDQQQAKEAIAQDLFFEPLRCMLSHMATIGLQKFTPELQDLFQVLENLLLGKDRPRSPQVFKTDKTFYSAVEGAATKTFEEIIEICQQS
jgi:hypothetical protein